MKLRKCASVAVAVAVAASAGAAARTAWPEKSAGDLSVFIAMQRFRIYADHCSVEVPALKPKFDSLVANLHARMLGFSKPLLDSAAFRGLKDKPVPAEIVDAFRDSFEDLEHNFERLDAVAVCPEALERVGELDDASLRSALTDALTGVQNMIRNMENEHAR